MELAAKFEPATGWAAAKVEMSQSCLEKVAHGNGCVSGMIKTHYKTQ